MKLKDTIGSMASRFAAIVLALTCVGNVWGAETTIIQNAAGEDITVYVVADGFYQNAATYSAATDFYITSKAGLEYFRDLVSACDGGTAITAYINGGFYPGQNVPGVYSNNLFKDKKVNLLCDIDLENEDWTPIGYPNWAYNNGSSKTQFYGSFNGNGHKISNLKVVANAYNQNQGPNDPNKYYKNYGAYGLFGALGSSGSQVFENLTIVNVTAVVGNLPAEIGGGTYIGAIVGNLGNNATTFRNCTVIGLIDLQGSANSAGGLYGIGSANVENCVVNGDSGSTIISSSFGGGLVGAMRQGNDLNVTGNTVSGLEITSYRAGSLVGAMALGVAGACSVTDNDIVDCIVNGKAATLDNLFGPSTATTEMTYARNTVRTTLIVETGDLTPAEAITEETKAVDYTVPVTVKDRAGNVISETAAQEIAVSVGNEDVADITLTSVKIGDVVTKAVESAGEDATSVTAIEIQVKASTEAEGEVQAITYEVHPEAVVKVTKTVEQAQTTTESVVELSNTDLAADAVFTFELDVSALGLNAGDTVRITHSWDAYTDASGNAVAAGSETTLGTVSAGQKVQVTATHFSTWTLEGVTVESETVAIVFAANGAEIDQYSSIADAIAAETTVNGCTVLVLDGEHDCGSETITINKEITLTGQSKAGTVLNFTANGVNAFAIAASNVTVKDMTIDQADSGTYNTKHVTVGSASNMPSGITLQNIKFTGGKYSVEAVASNLTIDSCEFVNIPSAPIMLYAVQGTTRITNNTSTQGNVKSDGGMIYHLGLSGNTYKTTGKMLVSGNTSTGGRALYFWQLASLTENLTLDIVNNKMLEYNNKGVVFYQVGTDLANNFDRITITNNVFSSSFKRPAILRDDTDHTLTINANYNYWGRSNPDFTQPIPSSNSKYDIDGENVDHEWWYNTYANGELSDLRPLPAVAQIVTNDGATINKYETLAEAIAAVPTDGTETTITMIANEAIDIAGNALAIAASKNVVLDLNGFQVVGFCSTGENSALILNNGTLTIVDSSDVNADGTGAGKLAYSASPAWNWSGVDGDYSGSYASNLISNNGTVSVESGLLEVINPAGTVISASYAIDSAPGGVVNIKGGKLTSACCDVIRVRVNNSSQSALNISGGSVVAVSPSNRAICVQEFTQNGNSTVTISGGLVSGQQYSILNYSSGSNAKTTITGGTFNGFLFTYSELDISDGAFNGGRRGSSTVYSVSAYGSKSHISGGVFYGRAEFYSTASSLDWSVTGGAFSNGGPFQYYPSYTSEEFVRGGIYDAEPLYIAPGFVLADNPDPVTKDAYPYAVVPAVASITSDDETTYYADLQTAIADAATGDTVTLLTDIELTEYQTIQGSTAKYGIIIDKAITIDGAGHTVTGNSDIARTFAVMNTTGEVTIKNITIKNSVAGAVCVYTYDVASLVLDNATLDTTGCPSGYNQPLTISGSGNVKSNVDVLNGSVVKTNDAATQYYAIIVWTPVDLTIDHSTVKGWACVYMKSGSAGSTVEITDSTLVSTGLSGSSDNFAALVTEADNVTMDVTGTEIDISAASGTYQGIGLPCNKSGVSIELGAGNNVTLSGDMAVIGFNMSQGDVTVSGGAFNKAVSDYYCAEGYIPVAQDSETGLYTVKEGVYRAQIVADGYATLSASISEASDDVYLDMWGFWNMKGMVDESGNECPQYVAITDDTMYRDLAIVSDDGVEAWVSAKYIYDNYLAPGKTYYGYQTYYLNEIAPVVKARYETLADAIAAVPTDGMETTIQMIADSVEASETAMTIASTQNVVIDLAGHTVSGTFAESKTAERDFIKNHGTLTVKDSSAAGTGKITMTTADSDNLYGSQNVTIYNEGGTFTLEGGCIENLSGYCAYAIVNSSNSWDQYIVSTFNMTGGSVSCPHGDQALRVYQNCAATQNENYTCQNYVNISGGTIVDTGIWLDGFLYTTGWDLTSYTGENIKTVVDISGGTINGLFDYSVRHPYNTEVKISGGTFTECRIRVRTDYTDGLEDDASPAFAISGGKFAFAANGGLTLGSGTAHHNVPYLLTGGYYTSEPAAEYIASGYGVYDGTTEYPYAVLPEHPVVVADQTTIAETTLALTGAGDATKFRLDEVSSDGKDRTKGAEQDVSSFSVDLENEMNSATVKYYQIVALKETTSSTEEDTSSAVIGVMKIESNQKNVIIPIPWASLSSGGEISVANLVRTATLTKGDTIEAYDAGTYKAWTLGSDGQWEASSVTSTSGTDKGTDADKFTIPRGAAVWLTRKDPSTPIYLVGAAASGSASITLEAGDAFEPSWNLVGNPTAAAVSVANVAKSTDDKIVVPTATVPKTYYYNESEQSWGYWTTEEVQIGSIAAVKSVWKTDDASIPAGTGFWYLNGGEAKNLWTGVEDEFDLDDAPTTEDTTGNL